MDEAAFFQHAFQYTRYSYTNGKSAVFGHPSQAGIQVGLNEIAFLAELNNRAMHT